MIKIKIGLNNIKLIKNYNSEAVKIQLVNVITLESMYYDCIDEGISDTKMLLNFNIPYLQKGEYNYKVLDINNNIISQGLGIVEEDNVDEIISYESNKEFIVYGQ